MEINLQIANAFMAQPSRRSLTVVGTFRTPKEDGYEFVMSQNQAAKLVKKELAAQVGLRTSRLDIKIYRKGRQFDGWLSGSTGYEFVAYTTEAKKSQ